MNANQLFQWRRQYRAGRLGGGPIAGAAIKLLPVSVEAEPSTLALPAKETPVVTAAPAAIHIKLGHVQIRIEGSPDPILLRTILESLRA